ncbi:single-stranded DNA-binding protein [Enemella sp. A6]|uniref:single-stranded DNA-binding protein n=1 Tax=Enemella sp. A6 TaxID=3440152 RepID=UPI003EB6FBCE
MEPQITITGNLGNEVDHRTVSDHLNLATFRLANTPRVMRNGNWFDQPTTWLTVQCWRQLADNVRDSLRKGDPVVVHGKLRTATWTSKEGEEREQLHIEAYSVGHDLTRGTVEGFRRNEKAAKAQAERDEASRQALEDAEGFEVADAEVAGAAAEPIDSEEAAA